MEFAGTERFALLSRLGEGGIGVVYEAFDRDRKSRVALKTLRSVLPNSVARLKHEFRSLQDLHHPNLIALYDLLEQGGHWFLTMELVCGVDFLEHVRHTTPFEEQRLREALRQLARGLLTLHSSGKVHRDIKPGNVMVSRGGRVVLLDFGLVTTTSAGGPHEPPEQGVLGTVEYMAPEQAAGDAGPPADWYSVGVMLYEALCGKKPFAGRPLQVLLEKQQREPAAPSSIAPRIPADLDRLCTELLRIDPAARPSAQMVLRQLEAPLHDVQLGPARPAPFVGRKRELAVLDRALVDVEAGRPVTVACLGEPGVGKTALVQRFLDRLPQTMVVCRGRCYQHEVVPYKGIDGLVDGLCAATRRQPADLAAQLLEPHDAHLVGRVFPVVQALAPRGVTASAPPLDPRQRRQEAVAALRRWVVRLAQRHPTLLVLEDLHWGGADTWAVIEQLLAPPDPPPLLAIVTLRLSDETHDQVASTDRLPGEVRPLVLERMGQDESIELATALLGDRTSEEMARQIADQAGGHPLGLLQIAHHALDQTPEQLPAADCRSTLEAALDQRLRGLAAEARAALELLSLAEAPLPIRALERALATSPEALEQHLVQLQLEWMVRQAHGAQVEPYHDLVRQALRRQIDPTRQPELHRRLALALEHHGWADPAMLAHHWQGAGEERRAADHSLRAATEADAALAFDRAARLYGRALSALPEAEPDLRRIEIRRGHALQNAGRGAAAAEAFLHAADGAEALEALDLRRHAAEQLLCSGHVDRGLKLLEQVLASVGVTMPRGPVGALAGTAMRWTRLGLRRYHSAPTPVAVPAEQLRRVDACWSATVGLAMVDLIRGVYFQAMHTTFALSCGDPHRILRALAMEIPFHAARGRGGERRTAQLVEMVQQLASRTEMPYARGLAAACLGLGALQQGSWSTAEEQLREAARIFRTACLGTAWELGTAEISHLWAQALLGQLGALARRVPVLLHEARQRGNIYASVSVAVGLPSWAWLTVDDPAAALEAANRGIERWSQRNVHIQHVFYHQAVADIDLYSGNSLAAYRRITEFWPRLARSRLLLNQLMRVLMLDLRSRCRLALLATDSAPLDTKASTLLARVRSDAARIERQKRGWADGLAALLRAGAAVVTGDLDETRAHLRRALEQLEACKMALHAAAARQVLARLEGRDSARAAEYMASQGVRAPQRMVAMLLPWSVRLPVAS